MTARSRFLNVSFSRRRQERRQPACPVLVLLFLSSLLSLPLTAATPQARNSKIEGTVVDASGATVPGARVRLRCDGVTAAAVTGTEGSFSFAAPAAGDCTVTAEATGFAAARQSLRVAAGKTVRLRLVLSPAARAEAINVTAARTRTALGETPLSDIALTSTELETTGALTIDDALRQVPGFSLFRRSGSRTANPTTQGVSLRGLGASGASRALVLEDGFPLNDPFGGWVYWGRVPRAAVESVEISQEGASSLYGSGALSGVVQFLTRRARPAGLRLETSYGNQNTPDLSFWTGGSAGRWDAELGAEIFHTHGYILVPSAERGSVDTAAGSSHETVELMLGRRVGRSGRVFGRGWYYNESRRNGTRLQRNSTAIGEGAVGYDGPLGRLGSVTLRFYGQAQHFAQTFSAIAADRMSERLVNSQLVPAQRVGGSAQWTRAAGRRQMLVAGLDAQEVVGTSNEELFAFSGGPSALQASGGRQRMVGIFGEDLIRFGRQWLVGLSGRWDHWRNFDASSTRTPLAPPGPAATTPFVDRSESAFSPRITLLHPLRKDVWLGAAFYRAFRAPTLNELYRSFRVGNVVTGQNDRLRAERLTGGEAGLGWKGAGGRAELRGSVFWNEIVNPIANVTLEVTPSLIRRQRQNLGRTRSAGVELEARARLLRGWELSAGYQYADAVVVRFPADRTLEGLWLPQVPRHVFTFQSRYVGAGGLLVGVDGRLVGVQYDDDRNLFPLGRFFVLDVTAARPLGHGVELFAAAENLFNEQYAVRATPVPTLGLPFTARVGLRYRIPHR